MFFEEFGLVGGVFLFVEFQAQVLAGLLCDFSSPPCSAEKADLQKIRLDHVLKRVPLFAECGSNGIDTGWAAIIDLDQRT